MKKCVVNGTALAYEEYGSGDKYLLCTQNFFFSDCHMALLGKPPYDYHVFLVYMRGYGESEHIFDSAPKNYTKIWGEDLIAFAKEMDIPSFYYTGISHGNWAGWYIAFHCPKLLRGFVCCDGIAQYRSVNGTQPRPRPNAEKLVGNREELSKIAWLESWPTDNLQRLKRREENHAEHTDILMAKKREEFEVGMNTDMTGCEAASEEEFFSRLAKIPVPLMLLNGALDPLARVEDVLKIAKTVPGAQMLIFQHLGHGGPDECPELTAQACHRFFCDTENYVL